MNQKFDQKQVDKLFNEYVSASKKVWGSFSLPQTEQNENVILVDCLVSFPPYILGNLIIAKYLQKWTKARIIGLVRNQQQLEWCKGFLHAFSVDNVMKVYEQGDIGASQINLGPLLKETDPLKIRKLILEFTIDGLPVGDLVYDDYLRNTGRPTVQTVSDELLNYFKIAVYTYSVYNKLCQQHKVIATVQGHTVYLLYGMLARVAVKNGATVYGRKPGARRMAIRRYSHLSDFPLYEIGFTPEHYNKIYHYHKDTAIMAATAYLADRFHGKTSTTGTNPIYLRSFDPSRKIFSRQEFRDSLGLSAGKPNVFIMCHVFSDAPHMDQWMIHDDYFLWLVDTLSIAAGIKHVNWIVKPHPDDKYYNCKEDFAVIETAKHLEKHDHMFLAPDDMHSASIIDVADAVVTVRGTAALEYTSQGIPCVVTGSVPYASFGYTIQPKSREEYIHILQNIHAVERLSEEQISRSLVGSYCFYYLSRVEGLFIPDVQASWHTDLDMTQFFQDAILLVTSDSIENDPLYRNFKIMVENNLPHLVDFAKLSK